MSLLCRHLCRDLLRPKIAVQNFCDARPCRVAACALARGDPCSESPALAARCRAFPLPSTLTFGRDDRCARRDWRCPHYAQKRTSELAFSTSAFCHSGPSRQTFAASANGSPYQCYLTRSPFLREERFERAVEAQDREPALFRIGLNPVAPLDPRGLGRAEVDRRRAVGVRLRRRATDSSGCRRADSAAACRASSASGCRRA